MENEEKLIKNQIKEWEKTKENALKDGKQELVGLCDKSIADLEKKLASLYQTVPVKQEVVAITPATDEQKKQSKGKLGKLKIALATALAGAGLLAIGILAGKKIQKDKDADAKANEFNNNEPVIEQEVKQNDNKTEIEKAVEETIAVEESKEEVEEVKEKIKDQVIEEKEETKKDNKEESNPTKEETNPTNQANNGNNNTNNGGNNGNNNQAPAQNQQSGQVNAVPTGVTETLIEDTGSQPQQVISTSTTTTGGEQTGNSSEIVENNEVNPDLEGGQVVGQQEANTQSDNQTTTETSQNSNETGDNQQPEQTVQTENSNSNNDSNGENESVTEEVVEDNVVLPEGLDPDLLAELQALYESQQGKSTPETHGKTR